MWICIQQILCEWLLVPGSVPGVGDKMESKACIAGLFMELTELSEKKTLW